MKTRQPGLAATADNFLHRCSRPMIFGYGNVFPKWFIQLFLHALFAPVLLICPGTTSAGKTLTAFFDKNCMLGDGNALHGRRTSGDGALECAAQLLATGKDQLKKQAKAHGLYKRSWEAVYRKKGTVRRK